MIFTKKVLDKTGRLCYNKDRKKEKEITKMKPIDLTVTSYHVDIERQQRFDIINKTVGFGVPVVEGPDRKGRDCTATLTTTGVIVIIDPHGVIVTAWVASVRQAIDVYRSATGSDKLPKNLWNMVNYNNNTALWQKMAA